MNEKLRKMLGVYMDSTDGDGDDLGGGDGAKGRGDDVDGDDGDDKQPKVKADDTKYVPKARFDEAVKKERDEKAAVSAKLQALEARQAEADRKAAADSAPEKIEQEIQALEDKMDQAAKDGQLDKVKELRAQIRAKMQEVAQADANEKAARATHAAVERIRYDAKVTELEKDFPAMDPDNEDEYDQGMVDDLLELKAAYEGTGMGSTDALAKAAKLVFKGYEPKEKKEDDDDADDSGASEEARKAAAELAAKRKEEAIRKAQEAKGKQPANQREAGRRSDGKGTGDEATNATKMNDRDFDKFAEKDPDALARARGDII